MNTENRPADVHVVVVFNAAESVWVDGVFTDLADAETRAAEINELNEYTPLDGIPDYTSWSGSGWVKVPSRQTTYGEAWVVSRTVQTARGASAVGVGE